MNFKNLPIDIKNIIYEFCDQNKDIKWRFSSDKSRTPFFKSWAVVKTVKDLHSLRPWCVVNIVLDFYKNINQVISKDLVRLVNLESFVMECGCNRDVFVIPDFPKLKKLIARCSLKQLTVGKYPNIETFRVGTYEIIFSKEFLNNLSNLKVLDLYYDNILQICPYIKDVTLYKLHIYGSRFVYDNEKITLPRTKNLSLEYYCSEINDYLKPLELDHMTIHMGDNYSIDEINLPKLKSLKINYHGFGYDSKYVKFIDMRSLIKLHINTIHFNHEDVKVRNMISLKKLILQYNTYDKYYISSYFPKVDIED